MSFADPWPAPHASGPVNATLTVPASKSLTNRYLILAALAEGPSLLRSPLHSRDSALMIAALRALGAVVEELPGEGDFGPDLRITPLPVGRHLADPVAIDCGLAGTVMRFVPPLAALIDGQVTFDGDPHARSRPMSPVIAGLAALGVPVAAADGAGGRPGSLPFTVTGTGALDGGYVQVDAAGSSQFVSALLLVGARFRLGIHLEHVGKPVPSPDHIAMTIAVLRELGVLVDDSVPNHWIVSPGPIRAFDVRIEQDLSNAGPFLAAALVTGGQVRIPHWPQGTSQVGDLWRTILPAMGAEMTLDGDSLVVRGGERILGGEFADTSELAPTVAALCALAQGPSRLSGIAHLRGHETDRLAALVTEINALGGSVRETADGLVIEPAPLHGGTFHTYADHRMATAGAILGLAVPGILVENIATTGKTMPEFPLLWQAMLAGSGPETAQDVAAAPLTASHLEQSAS
ncbi:3-phosphoshikimate 1-carboxyvinyltransferase [Psychromicrobium xiongbiense]|uniref:3-phosphoshikimate 1-carboxyvinyltransferase n=1 Tax=Psychromicrobium xiongbiense TaxID=3051184 RepID=UPI002555A533|nr:3-phosphoshikimate 1-carboxyvinyltransferase [Psychromicrobium sp. YIM S02556]